MKICRSASSCSWSWCSCVICNRRTKAKSDLSLSSASKNFFAAQPARIWKAHDGIRTRDLFLTKEVLYRLSYMGIRALLNRSNRSPKKENSVRQKNCRRSGPSPDGFFWSGKRDSNPRPRAWKARALPTELFPLSPSNSSLYWWRGEDSNLRRHKPADLQSAPFGHSGTSPPKAIVPTKPMARIELATT